MGTKHRQRRRDKAKRAAERERLRHRRQSGTIGRPPLRHHHVDTADVRAALWALSGVRIDAGLDPGSLARAFHGADVGLFCAEAEAILLRLVDLAWQHGWQPNELARHGRRSNPAIGQVVATAIAADHAGRDRTTLHPEWVGQADEFRLGDLPRRGWLRELVHWSEDTYDTGERWLLADSIRLCAHLRTLPVLIPPPGSDPSVWVQRDAAADDPVLAKVRALLAQAESTTFEAEAETFTAKAQELMARHAIDAARLWDRAERSETPITIRLSSDDPYADTKAMLLQMVATNSRCRMVIHGDTGLNSVTGFASDVAFTELLYTSLLVQSQAALQAEAVAVPPGSHVRSRKFRSSFLMAYAHRIGERLAVINEQVTGAAASEADTGPALLPVLAARNDRVDRAVDEMFPRLEPSRFRAPRDALGLVRGEQAADRAELNRRLAATDAPRVENARHHPRPDQAPDAGRPALSRRRQA